MLPAPFFNELPSDLGEDTTCCARAPAEHETAASAQHSSGTAPQMPWHSPLMNALSWALGGFAWGYSTWG